MSPFLFLSASPAFDQAFFLYHFTFIAFFLPRFGFYHQEYHIYRFSAFLYL